MKLIFEDNGSVKKFNVHNIAEIEHIIEKTHPSYQPYTILVRDNGDYIQCAGSKERLTIEVRFNNQSTFKHYVVGKNEQSKVWSKIECKVGPILVLSHEILTIKEAKDLFINFYNTGEILSSFNKRNVTKNYVE